jgi:hypothetical protein
MVMNKTSFLLQIFVGMVLFISPSFSITAQTSSEEAASEILPEVQERVDKAMNRLSQVAGLSEEQRNQIEPIMLEMLLEARIIIQDTETPLETRQEQMTLLLETTRAQIEPLLTPSQYMGFGLVWGRVSAEVMGRLE